MRSFLATLLLAGVASTQVVSTVANGQRVMVAQPTPQGSVTDVIDFEGFPAGFILDQVFGAGGLGPVGVSGFNPGFGAGTNAAIIFDTNMRTGGDVDLGTPNEDFGGPGEGPGGEMGSAFENDQFQDNVLIVAENLTGGGDGIVDDPDDADLPGSLLVFDFSALGTVTIDGITLLDVEADEPNAAVELYDDSMSLIGAPIILPPVGDNGLGAFDLGSVDGVQTMIVDLNGSGAVDDIVFSQDLPCTGRIGDRVWADLDSDGIQDAGEPGIPGVLLELKDASGAVIDVTQTNANGLYLFTDLCAGEYCVCVVESSLPPGLEPSPCNVGDDDARDNDCSPACTELETDDDEDRTLDFGYRMPPTGGGGEGCTPGYWKQPHHFDSWTAPYTPGTLFGDVFENAFPGKTLLQVVKQGGGGLKALGRHTVAALLNTASDGVDYGKTPGDVISAFNDVYPGTKAEYNTLKGEFESDNESGCPLN